MRSIGIIKKFVESNWFIERAVRDVLERLPLRFRYGISYGPTFRYWLGFLKESEKWDRDRLKAFQIEQLRDLLMHAGKNVPYYKRAFDEYDFKPEKIQCLDDIKILPSLDRKMVKEKYEEFIAENIPKRKLFAANTSGSTGIPLTVYGTKETEEKHWATIVDLWSRIGYSPKSRTISFEANIREGNKNNLPWKKFGNALILSSNYFVDKWLDKYIEMINNFEPEYLIGFPHTIATFSSYLKGKKSVFDRLKGIIVYAENLYEWQKELISEVFGVRVFSDYGMVEKVIHGGECEHSHAYHLNPQYGLTEYLDVGNSLYELVGTGFINYAMPLIRYRSGDICKKGNKRCSLCGRSYELLESLEGRTGDFLVDADGQIISVYLTIDFKVFENIERFQLYQEFPGEVELRLWPKDSFRTEDTKYILSEIKQSLGLFGDRIKFNVVLMRDRASLFIGKYRMVDQRLDIKQFLMH